MRALLPKPVDDVDVHAHYADDWAEGSGWRVNFIASVDGAVTAGGVSRGLQTAGDNVVFAALRDLADGVVVGSGTAAAEGYGPVRPRGARAARRREYGFGPRLPIAVVSGRLRVDPSAALYESRQTIVITCAAAPADVRERLAEKSTVLVCGEAHVDLHQAKLALAERGLRRIICEGGPTLFAEAIRSGVVDELCLTVSPVFVGPGPGRIVAGSSFGAASRLPLHGLLEEDGALFCRYAVPGR